MISPLIDGISPLMMELRLLTIFLAVKKTSLTVVFEQIIIIISSDVSVDSCAM